MWQSIRMPVSKRGKPSTGWSRRCAARPIFRPPRSASNPSSARTSRPKADIMDTLSTDGISLTFRPESGIIDDLVITGEGAKELRPLHRAPWVRSGEDLPRQVAPVERRLAGDFFCAPFGRTIPDMPIHGWAANGTWEKSGSDRATNGAV